MGAGVNKTSPGVNETAPSELEMAIMAAPSFYDALRVRVGGQVWGRV